MEQAHCCWFLLLLLLFFFFPIYKLLLHTFKYPNKNHPPSPPALPFISHLHLLNQPLHRTLHHLSQKYGNTMLLQFGWRKVLVISSPSAVEECFTKNDIVFANRPKLLSGKLLGFDYDNFGLSPYGDYWRNLRRFTTIEIFSSKSLAAFAKIRHEEVVLLMKKLYQDHCRSCTDHKHYLKVTLRQLLVDNLMNIMMRMLIGKRYFGTDEESEEGSEFKEIIREIMELLEGTAYLGDYISIMKVVDVFRGVKRRMLRVRKKMEVFLQGLLDEQRIFRNRNSSGNKGDTNLLDRMLALQETDPDFYNDKTIKATIMGILLAGAETSSTTIEWGMALLLSHPNPMFKAYNEINSLLGKDHIVNESDFQELQYLQSVVSETLRLFPPAPLLLPHESSIDCIVSGFHIPRGTMLMVNSWSIQRDPTLWSQPEKFMPERFESDDDKVRLESSYQFLPFGIGRRACPGSVLGKRMTGMVLGALIQCFEWQRVGEAINMSEGTGLTVPPLEVLEVLLKPREDMVQLLSRLEV